MLVPCELVRYESEPTGVVWAPSVVLRPLPFQHGQFLMGPSQFMLQMVNHLHHFSSTWVVVIPPTTVHVPHIERPYITDVLALRPIAGQNLARNKRYIAGCGSINCHVVARTERV